MPQLYKNYCTITFQTQLYFCFFISFFTSLNINAQSFERNYALCDSLSNLDQYADAKTYCMLAYQEAKNNTQIQDTLVMHAALSSAYAQYQSGDYEAAVPAFENLADILFNRSGETDSFVWVNEQLFGIYQILGDHEKKISYLNTIIKSLESLYGDQDINLWYYYYLAGEEYILNGDYAASIRYFISAGDLYLVIGRPQDGNYARILVENSSNFLIVGKYEESIENDKKALKILESLDEKYPEIVADAYQLMSWSYRNLGMPDTAIDYVNKLIAVVSELDAFTMANNLVSSTLFIINLDIEGGTFYAKEAGLDKVLHQALAIYDSVKPDAIFINNVYIAFGNYFSNEKMYDSVTYYYVKSLSLIEKAYGKNNIIYLNGFYSLASNYLIDGDTVSAELIYDSLLHMSESFLSSNFIFLSESEKESIFTSFTMYRTSIFNFYHTIENTQKNKAEIFYNSELFMKGILLQNITSMRNNIMQNKDPGILQDFNDWITLKQNLAALYLNKDPQSEVVEKQTEALERKLTQKNVFIKNVSASANWKAVQSALKSDEVAIEFMFFPDAYDFNYYALILTPDSEEPIAIPLFEGNKINTLLARNGNESISNYINRIYTFPDPAFPDDSAYYSGEKLFHLLWSPLEQYVKDAKTIYLSPTGILHQIAFNAIPVNATQTLLDKYNISIVSSTGDILNKHEDKSLNNFFLAGGIDYGSDAIGGTYAPWNLLPGTLSEIRQIESQLKTNNKNVTLVSNSTATENYIKNLAAPSYQVLHLATHGYFYDEVADENVSIKQNKFSSTKNPMLRSGLIFADANNYWYDTNANNNDGTLTAYEISNMNLFGVSLVVLSACETGLGDIRGSEGVYGLQRAFKMAGAEQLILSLWKVPDAYTSELMDKFYGFLLDGNSPEVSLKKAQLYMKKKSSVFNWGAFVLIN